AGCWLVFFTGGSGWNKLRKIDRIGLMPQQIFQCFPFPDQIIFSVVHHDFSWSFPGIIIGCHLKTIRSGIPECKYITNRDFWDWPVPGKVVSLTDIPDD